MFKFIFRMSDGSKNVMNNVPEGFDRAIWDQLDEYCAMFESDTKKVVSVMQVKEC